jgi:hypothetical protein
MKKVFSALSVILMFAVLSIIAMPTAFAIEFAAGEEVYLSDIMLDDTYIAGGLVSITEDISGDLLVAGGNVTIDANIEGDLFIIGGQVTINGNVEDDLRMTGGSLSVNGNIGDDLIATGGQLHVGKNSLIGGSLVLGTGFADILGTVNEDIIGSGGRIIIGGTVYRDINLQVHEILTLTKDAKVNGNLIYTSLREAELKETQVAGYIEFNKQMPIDDTNISEKVETFFTRGYLIWTILSYLAILLIAFLFVFLAPVLLIETTKISKAHPWRSLGIGLIVAICGFAATIILMITVIGFSLAVILGTALSIALYLSKLYAAMLVGNLLVHPKKMTRIKLFGIIALGGFIITVIGIVPYIGWIATLGAALVSFGAMCTYKKVLYDKLELNKI